MVRTQATTELSKVVAKADVSTASVNWSYADMSPLAAETAKYQADALVKAEELRTQAAVANAEAKARIADSVSLARRHVAEENTKSIILPAQEETKRDRFKVFVTMGVVGVVIIVTALAVPEAQRAAVLEVCGSATVAAWAGVKGFEAWMKRK